LENNKNIEPDNTAVRTALWRALHVLIDAEPHIIEDEIGLRLAEPKDDWRQLPEMDPEFTKRLRASMVARARFIEDLIVDESENGVGQYVILGAGLDTFAQRRPDIAAKLQIYEIDQPNTQTWKKQRLIELGYGIPEWLHFVSVDFEASSWLEKLLNAGFDIGKPAVIVCTGVTLYLTKDAIAMTLKEVAKFAAGSTLAMTFYLPMDLMDEEDKFLQQLAEKGARAAGTPFVSFFPPVEMVNIAREAGFNKIEIVSKEDITKRYFTGRTDNLYPASGEEFLIAGT